MAPPSLRSPARRVGGRPGTRRAAAARASPPFGAQPAPAPHRPRSPPASPPRGALTSGVVPGPRRAAAPALPPAPAGGAPLGYEILQGAMVCDGVEEGREGAAPAGGRGQPTTTPPSSPQLRGTSPGPRPPPTAVLVHGILGSRRNLASFGARLLEGFPSWQVLLVDLRCHGESAALRPAGGREADGVEGAAADVLALLSHLRLFPEVLIGHSFGGKVAMSMADLFGRRSGGALPRPVHVWVLDALPGAVRGDGPDPADHPARLLDALRSLPTPLPSRQDLATRLTRAGFSLGVARWAATNLAPVGGDQGRLDWCVDLAGIASMYADYEAHTLWPFLKAPAKGVDVSFVRAARSEYRWAGGDADHIASLGHAVHMLPGAGHWVHAENPDGLFDILAPSFGGGVDLHGRRAAPGSPGLV